MEDGRINKKTTEGAVKSSTESWKPNAGAWFVESEPIGAADSSGLPELGILDEEAARRFGDVIEGLERELKCRVDPRQRATLFHFIGRLHEAFLFDERRGAMNYQKALQNDPHHRPSLHAARRMFTRAGRWGMVLRLLESESGASKSQALRARRFRAMGDLYLHRFGAVDEAIACFAEALVANSRETLAIHGLHLCGQLRRDKTLLAQALNAFEALDTSDEVWFMIADSLAWSVAFDWPDLQEKAWQALSRRLPHGAVPTLSELCKGNWEDDGEQADLFPGLFNFERLLSGYRKLAMQDDAGESWFSDSSVSGLMSFCPFLLSGHLRREWSQCVSGFEHALDTELSGTLQLVFLEGLAGWFERLGDVDAAFGCYGQMIEQAPECSAAVEGISFWSEHLGEHEALLSALPAWLAAQGKARDRGDILTETGLALHTMDRFKDAAKCLAAAMQLCRVPVVPARIIRAVHEMAGDFDAAEETMALEAAFYEDDVLGAEVYLELGRAREASSNWSGAAEAYRLSHERQPDGRGVFKALERTANRGCAWLDLAMAYESRAEISSLDRDVFLARAAEVWSKRLGDRKRAIELLQAAVHDGAGCLDVRTTLAELLIEEGQWLEASRVYSDIRQWSASESMRRAVTMRLASLYAKKVGDRNRARTALLELIESEPAAVEALALLSALEAELGNKTGALVALTRAMNATEDSAVRVQFKLQLARLHLSEGRNSAAITAIESAISDGGRGAALYKTLGDAATAMGDWNRARLAYEYALKLGKGGQSVPEIQKALNEVARYHCDAGEGTGQGPSLEQLRWMALHNPLDVGCIRSLCKGLESEGKSQVALALRRLAGGLDGQFPNGLDMKAERPSAWSAQRANRSMRSRLRTGGDTEIISAFARLVDRAPMVFGPMPPAIPVSDDAWVQRIEGIKSALGIESTVVQWANLPIGSAVRTTDGLLVSSALKGLQPRVSAVLITLGLELGAWRLDIGTRWSEEVILDWLKALCVSAGLASREGCSERIISWVDSLSLRTERQIRASEMRRELALLSDVFPVFAERISKSREQALRLGALIAGGAEFALAALEAMASAEGSLPWGPALRYREDLVRWSLSPAYADWVSQGGSRLRLD